MYDYGDNGRMGAVHHELGASKRGREVVASVVIARFI